MSTKAALVAVGACALSAGLAGGWFLSGRPTLSAPPGVEAPAPQAAPTAIPAAGLPDLSAVAEAALKVSANIASLRTIVRRDDFFSQFFFGQPQSQQLPSLGSGVLVSADGYVLTNTHVIGNAGAEVRVTLSDGQERPGKVIGIDEVSDLAVVQVEAPPPVPLLPWGDSSTLRVAEWVMAVGNPFQLSNTVTLGIVSTVNRSGAQVGSEYSDFIQTDAAINPGNSGGPLVNARGELVGINTMIYSSSGGYQGIGFAIPSNTARHIMSELIEHGAIRWGSLGPRAVRWVEMDRQTARAYRFGDVEGLLVYQIATRSSLYQAGLRPGDIVVGFNGQPVRTLDELNRLVIPTPVGSRAPLEVVREGRRLTISVPIVPRN
jgi:S1-C subfamily serine protease